MSRLKGRKRRHLRIRKKIFGTPERPRLAVYRSLRNLFAQIIDDTKGHTLLSFSTLNEEIRKNCPYGGNIKAASLLGEFLSKKAKEKGITKVVFDRAGFSYHGRIKAFCEAARKGGLEF
jgi:large subunit ribosomal protein L18